LRLAEIVAEVLELYQPTAAQSGVEFRVRMEAPLTVNGDPSLLAQAVRNLADNAINYAPPGSPTDILNFSAFCLRNAVPMQQTIPYQVGRYPAARDLIRSRP
jgi:C4-dicarboxylate-specific signal transduction histidine kinase